MQIHEYPSIPQAPADADVLAIEVNGITYKVSKAVLAAAIIDKLGGDPVTVAHGGTGSSSASGARTNLSVYSKSETDSAIQQSTAEALNGLKFRLVFLTANTPKTITVSNSARAILFFVASFASCCGEAALAHYGSGHSDGPIWFREATGITIDTTTNGRIVLTATQNTFCSLMALSGTYAEA